MKTKTLTIRAIATFGCLVLASVVFAAPESISGARNIPPEITGNLERWDWFAYRLRILQVILGVVGTAAALLVTTFTEQLGVRWTKICSFIAALTFGIISAFDIGSKADATRRAWRHLNTAIMKYNMDTSFTTTQLIDAYSEAEAMVGPVPFRKQEIPSTSPSPPH